MTTTLLLRITMKSATTFGRGDGVAGLIDREVEHDRYGFPYLRGRALKGLLAESAENVAFALQGHGQADWLALKRALFGHPGRGLAEHGVLHVSDARLPEALRVLLRAELKKTDSAFTPETILDSLTAIRRQTAMNPDGGPERATLRAMRVLLPGVVLESIITAERDLSAYEKQLLTAATLDLRRAGTGRNRGRGWLKAELVDAATTRDLFQQLAAEVKQS
jgi:hypothetical protein